MTTVKLDAKTTPIALGVLRKLRPRRTPRSPDRPRHRLAQRGAMLGKTTLGPDVFRMAGMLQDELATLETKLAGEG